MSLQQIQEQWKIRKIEVFVFECKKIMQTSLDDQNISRENRYESFCPLKYFMGLFSALSTVQITSSDVVENQEFHIVNYLCRLIGLPAENLRDPKLSNIRRPSVYIFVPHTDNDVQFELPVIRACIKLSLWPGSETEQICDHW